MSYEVIKWKDIFIKDGRKWFSWITIGSVCITIAGIGTMLGCGIRTVAAKPTLDANEQTFEIGWFNFKSEPIQTLIDSMVPDSKIVLREGTLIIPRIYSYSDFLGFSKDNKDTLELIRDIGVPNSTDQSVITPITEGQKTLVDAWVIATGFKHGANSGIAFITIGMASIMCTIVLILYLQAYKKKLNKLNETNTVSDK